MPRHRRSRTEISGRTKALDSEKATIVRDMGDTVGDAEEYRKLRDTLDLGESDSDAEVGKHLDRGDQKLEDAHRRQDGELGQAQDRTAAHEEEIEEGRKASDRSAKSLDRAERELRTAHAAADTAKATQQAQDSEHFLSEERARARDSIETYKRSRDALNQRMGRGGAR